MKHPPVKKDRSRESPKDPLAGIPDSAQYWWPTVRTPPPRRPLTCDEHCLGCGRDTQHMERFVVRIHEGRLPKTAYRWKTIGVACSEACLKIAYENHGP